MFIEDRYEIDNNYLDSIFEFKSTGKKGEITKIVRFDKTGIGNVFNLGFGDKDLKNGILDDKVISDNGDFEKVLATVASTVYSFTQNKPNSVIIIRGTNKARVRLYQIGISKYFEKIYEDFEVYGLTETDWQPFIRNTRYRGFLLQRKNNFL